MTIIDVANQAARGVGPDTSTEMPEDQVAGLYHRAATFEEEEFLLNREVEELQAEINRLRLKLEAMRAERDRVMDKIESISMSPGFAGDSGLAGQQTTSPFFADC